MDVSDPQTSADRRRMQRSQRWRDRRALFVPDASVIDPGAFAVDVIAPSAARAFVVRSPLADEALLTSEILLPRQTISSHAPCSRLPP